ncbi:preprotein translocase subunit SecA [Acinetobacter sp. HY1485]|uniref:preprotein translocase subunit SecA n=1 Tax=Acinetobacter sp. HY1485 TaxID=2970918 RepID=UPI0022B98CBF|nr:preprotein translocase subunit SecA [Acinetobacter sp. HY1485]
MKRNKFHRVDHNSLAWKIYLGYDILMMLIIVVNLLCLIVNAILMSHFADWLSPFLHANELLTTYRNVLHPWVEYSETWFICFLVAEFFTRWFVSIVQKHHQRWFFFPFIHWYEVLAIFPALRFFRLLRAGIIAYRLHELGYQVVPLAWQKTGRFYYNVLMEELSDRVIITAIDGVKQELDTSSTHKQIIHDLVDHHRDMFAHTFAQLLQETLATELRKQHLQIAQGMGSVIEKAIADTPELTQMLRLIPIVGAKIEDQIQHIGKRLGQNVVDGLLQPLTTGSTQHPNPTYQHVAQTISQLNIDNHQLEQLVESVVYETLAAVRKQVKVKQWQHILNATDQN